ncbi:adenosine deaminase [Legionella lansingensis]|uniref:Adenosine deaminase n=1 Tax=Legionella lansingensis TaxID=45067 RepID=A0A0W0V752_9GAMM|nr:adenosine deaminase [Legionella lansingensis]KTD15964.1 adenosine deaminase [Legionella lansingensis]SNV53912.1 adenosine deaminase [Legionella lansingensis]
MTIKKAELHSHLEGTIPPWLAKKLAKRNKMTLPPALFSDDEHSYQYQDFLDFLKTFDKVAEVIRMPEDYYDITFEYLKMNAENDTIYIEMMYSPDHAEQASGIHSCEHLKAIQQAIDDAEEKFNIIGRIIITGVRHFGIEAVTKVAKQATKEKESCIVGFGLGGDEINFPPKLFKKAYEIAAAGGLHCTVHAGEFAPASGVLEAIQHLPVKRIGHGVQAIHCPETLAKLKDKNIALEICPSSNITLGLFKDMLAHPLPQFVNAGITISLGSDDPPFFRTDLAKEYERVQQSYQYTDEQMKNFTVMAIESSFADDNTKAKLKKQLER